MIIETINLTKRYGDLVALNNLHLNIEEGECFGYIGPNGAGKTTLISTICGIASLTEGRITVGGHDVVRDYRQARSLIGLVPQEVKLEIFETVMNTTRFSRGLFGKPRDDAYIEDLLHRLSLWDKRNTTIRELSGGMMRRVLIAKALSHQPRVLFLDEPTAGVDVELRKSMWGIVRDLRAGGATIILTTHYIEEAEVIADRVGVITGGRILLVEDKTTLMRRMGRKRLTIELRTPISAVPEALASYGLVLSADGSELVYSYDTGAARTGITALLGDLAATGLGPRDLRTEQDSLEDIFVNLVKEGA